MNLSRIALRAVLFAALLILLAGLTGCKSDSNYAKPGLDANSGTGAALTSTGATLEVLGGTLGDLKTFVVEKGIGYYSAAVTLTQRASEFNAKAEVKNAQQRTEILNLGEQVKAQEDRYEKFRSKLSVRIAIFIENVLRWILIGYFILGVAGAVLTGFGLPGFGVGKFILNMLPFSNLFSWGSRYIEKKRARP